ncbi:hypothetical protein D9M68_890790 [compost metagenome]
MVECLNQVGITQADVQRIGILYHNLYLVYAGLRRRTIVVKSNIHRTVSAKAQRGPRKEVQVIPGKFCSAEIVGILVLCISYITTEVKLQLLVDIIPQVSPC